MKKLWTYLGCILLLAGCSDFFEKDISNGLVRLLSPADSSRSTNFSQKLKWERLDGALTYRLEIVSPSFNSISSYLEDTIISQTEFIYTFQPGNYQWRVKALNGSSETTYSMFNLTIDTTSDLSGQNILIRYPVNNSFTNKEKTIITWDAIYNATSYEVQLASPDFSNSANIFVDTLSISNSIGIDILNEGTCQVRVRAKNSSGISPYSQYITFVTDFTLPNVPVLLLPANNATVNNPVGCYWDRGIYVGSPIIDSVYIYSDTLVTKVRYFGTSLTNYKDSLPVGTYFWRVRSFDLAGNASQFSIPKKFKIQ